METKITKTWQVQGKEIYEVTMKFLLESKTIYFIGCTCPNFTGIVKDKNGKPKLIGSRRIKAVGELADTKYFAEPDKHIKPFLKYYESQGFKLKQPKPMTGTDKCTAELRRFIMERADGACEMYNCGRIGKEIHRKIPKTSGGKYNKDNCILLCKQHHEFVTFQKWHGSPGAKR